MEFILTATTVVKDVNGTIYQPGEVVCGFTAPEVSKYTREAFELLGVACEEKTA